MNKVAFVAPKRIVVEIDAVKNLAATISDFQFERVLLVTDKGIRDAGLLNESLDSLTQAGKGVFIFDGVVADPTEKVVLRALECARSCQPDLIIGIGGGSSLDVAKVIAILAHPDCQLELGALYGIESFRSEKLPLILVPTTAGTGSEVTPISIITTGETTKAGIVSPFLLPDLALLDARLTLGLPQLITAATGIDAMVHAIEAFTGRLKKNPISDMYALRALSLLTTNIEKVVTDGSDIIARQQMLMGSMLAGQAFANSPVGAIHALAYPLGGHFHIPHGLSNALVMTEVMKFNLPECFKLYGQLVTIMTNDNGVESREKESAMLFIEQIEQLIVRLGLPTRLRDCGVNEQSLPLLAKEAMKQERLLMNNPRQMTEKAALEIYTRVF